MPQQSTSINGSKSKVMAQRIPGEQRQTIRPDDEPLEDVHRLKYLLSVCIANGQVTEEIRSKINFARSAFS